MVEVSDHQPQDGQDLIRGPEPAIGRLRPAEKYTGRFALTLGDTATAVLPVGAAC